MTRNNPDGDLLSNGVIHSAAHGGIVTPVMVATISAVTIARVSLRVTEGQWHQGYQSKELGKCQVRSVKMMRYDEAPS